MRENGGSLEQGYSSSGHGFGTAPVFLAAICTILGAIMFLRFGYAVAHVGLLGGLMIIVIGHLITIPTALAVSEIATNQKVEGGGEYYIISRSFGTAIGGTIGISLYLSQAVSVAFYLLAFAEAFHPVFRWFNGLELLPFAVTDPRIVSVPAMAVLIFVMLKRGADVGVRLLWVVAGILALSLVAFFLGGGTGNATGNLMDTVAAPHSFNKVFAICFPAFTGMTAGVGLSGDLRNPRRSIPVGTLAATLVGMLAYVAIVIKLWLSASPQELAADPLIMGKIAVWEPIILMGLAAATLSSALGSILVAPRTLQALGNDQILPSSRINALLAAGRGNVNEPFNATVVSGALAATMVILGDIDMVAQIISMFFMVTYGALCGISFLEHFAANPSYRPTFRTRWYLSLAGLIMCVLMMFQMSPLYAILAIAVMHAIYFWLRVTHAKERDLTAIIQGVMFQLTRHLHVSVQKQYASTHAKDWRPSVIMISDETFDRNEAFDLLRWLSHRYGFSTLVHYIPGKLSEETTHESRRTMAKLIKMTEGSRASVFVDTVVSPNFETALAQMTQMVGISGLENNSVLFEFAAGNAEKIERIVGGCRLVAGLEMNLLVLRSSGHRFGFRNRLHVWLTEEDEVNANLLILLAFIISGHPSWDDAEITVFASFQAAELEKQRERLVEKITSGRLPISKNRLRFYPFTDEERLDDQIIRYSGQADLVLRGFCKDDLQENKEQIFTSLPGVRDILFVHCARGIEIV
ncbi:MAG: amino acid permease [Elusimicrobiota bacterium]